MSVASEIERIRTQKSKIRNKLVTLGLATSTDNLDKLATAVDGITNHTNIQAEVLEGSTYTIPKGYHNGSGVVIAKTDVEGDYARYVLQAKTGIIPSEQQQIITSDEGNYGLSSVTVEPIPSNYKDVSNVNTVRDDVLANKIFIDKDGNETTGTMQNYGAQKLFLGRADDKDNWISRQFIQKGYHDGNGYAYIDTEIPDPVTPDRDTKTIKPSAGKVLKQVTVNPIPDKYIDSTDASIVKDADDLTVNENKVDVPAGYYPNSVQASVPKMDILEELIDVFAEPVGTDEGGNPLFVMTDVNRYVKEIWLGIDPSLENALSEI